MVLAMLAIAVVVSTPSRQSMQGAVVEPFSLPLIANAPAGDQAVPGGEVLVLEFFATWCGACRAELPRAQARALQADVQLIAISLDDTAQAASGVVKRWGLTSPVAFDERGIAQRTFRIQGLPTMVVLSAGGVVTGWFTGSPSDEAFLAALSQAREL